MDAGSIQQALYKVSTTHYELDTRGRTTNSMRLGCKPGETTASMSGEDSVIVKSGYIVPYKLIDSLQVIVERWRESCWQVTITKTRKVLDSWQQRNSSVVARLFWCQIWTVEIIIWIMLWILVDQTNRATNNTTYFLVPTPNLLVRKRLSILNPKKVIRFWYAITPRVFYGALNSVQVMVVNLSIFRKYAIIIGNKPLRLIERMVLDKSNTKNFKISKININQVMLEYAAKPKVMVINETRCRYTWHETQIQREDLKYQETVTDWYAYRFTFLNEARILYFNQWAMIKIPIQKKLSTDLHSMKYLNILR